jgi:hypothetical protein
MLFTGRGTIRCIAGVVPLTLLVALLWLVGVLAILTPQQCRNCAREISTLVAGLIEALASTVFRSCE